VRGTAQQPRLFVGMILILIFAEVLGTYIIQVLRPYARLTTSRSVRTHRRPSHELPRRQVLLLNSPARNDEESQLRQYSCIEIPHDRRSLVQMEDVDRNEPSHAHLSADLIPARTQPQMSSSPYHA
jgi:hypothetical protein